MDELDWRRLPSLTALRAFEATARLGSFSAASRELNVTHAAVAQQVRGLEDSLGVTLAQREGRGVSLTPDGAQLASALRDGFGTIQAAVRDLLTREAEAPLKISLTPAFATQWLMPRLGRFWDAHSDIPVSLHPERALVDLRRDGMDLAIRFGEGDWPGVEEEFLLSAGYVIVAAPGFLRGRIPDHDEMTRMPWIVEGGRPEPLAWLRSQGFEPDSLKINFIPTDDLANAAAYQGYGLYVEPGALAVEDVKQGRLQMVYTNSDRIPAYFLVTRPGPKKPQLKTFIRWLKSEVRDAGA